MANVDRPPGPDHSREPLASIIDLVVDVAVRRYMARAGERDYATALHAVLNGIPTLKKLYAGRETP